jgi:hypothetical protein
MLKTTLILAAALMATAGAGAAEPFTCPKDGDTFVRIEVQPGTVTLVELPGAEPLYMTQDMFPQDTIIKREAGGHEYRLCIARVQHADALRVHVTTRVQE